MSDINTMVIRTALRDMFNKGRVDICAIKECIALAGVTPDGKTLAQLHALHCVSFTQMDPELAQAIPSMVAKLFAGVVLSVDDLYRPPNEFIVMPSVAEKPHGFLRLLGVR